MKKLRGTVVLVDWDDSQHPVEAKLLDFGTQEAMEQQRAQLAKAAMAMASSRTEEAPAETQKEPLPAPALPRLGSRLRFPERHCPCYQILVPPSTTGEVSSTPSSSSRRHTGPGSTSSASKASSWKSTELADVPGNDDSDDSSANEPVDEQSVPAAGTVVDRRTLSTNSRSSSFPSLSERLEDTGTEDADDGAHDTPVEAPTMEMPPDHTMLVAEQVRALRATLHSAPTTDSWVTCEQAWSRAVALAAEAVRLPSSTPGRRARDVNPDNATQMQRLYRRNHRRAVRLIVEGPTRSCTIPIGDIQDHWTSTWSPRAADISS
ncbi:hypothetical protein MRX96_042103 [Rhipicephalus microplus]